VAVGDAVELHYVERGQGVAVLFIHGSLGDYSTWDRQLGPFAGDYRAIAYSRRYNYPNTNKLRPKHSAAVEAEDLAAFIKKLDLGKVHVIGHSYGGYTALFLAVKHPELVRTMTLAEPPVVFAGDRVEDAKMRLVKRARAAFEKGDPEDAVRKIAVPALLLSGEKSTASHRSVDEELERLLPEKGRQRVIIREADHGMWFQHPEACRKAVLEFLSGK
jgi:pimeloyl-ACP methyl ester carboxylesterase